MAEETALFGDTIPSKLRIPFVLKYALFHHMPVSVNSNIKLRCHLEPENWRCCWYKALILVLWCSLH